MNYEFYYRQQGIEDDVLSDNKHVHDSEIEIIHIVSGSGKILMGNHFATFRSGDVFIIDTNIIHCTSPDIPCDYVRNKLLFDKTILLYFTETDISCTYFHDSGNELNEMFERINMLCTANSSSLSVLSEMLKLIDYCLLHEKGKLSMENSISANVIGFINRHLTGDLSLDTISNAVHISKYHLCRVFKAETGITLGSYIQNMRLSVAKQKLIFSSDSISKISAEMGFVDSAAFNKMFRSSTGMSPSQYRKIYGIKH